MIINIDLAYEVTDISEYVKGYSKITLIKCEPNAPIYLNKKLLFKNTLKITNNNSITRGCKGFVKIEVEIE